MKIKKSWIILMTAMTPGLSFFYGGMVGAKNVISTMLQLFIAMGLISVLWAVIDFSLCIGDDIGGMIGNPLTFPMFRNVGPAVYTFAMSWTGYKLIDHLIPIRVSEYSEKVGLDFSQHDEHYGLAHIGERELADYEEHIISKK